MPAPELCNCGGNSFRASLILSSLENLFLTCRLTTEFSLLNLKCGKGVSSTIVSSEVL